MKLNSNKYNIIALRSAATFLENRLKNGHHHARRGLANKYFQFEHAKSQKRVLKTIPTH